MRLKCLAAVAACRVGALARKAHMKAFVLNITEQGEQAHECKVPLICEKNHPEQRFSIFLAGSVIILHGKLTVCCVEWFWNAMYPHASDESLYCIVGSVYLA